MRFLSGTTYKQAIFEAENNNSNKIEKSFFKTNKLGTYNLGMTETGKDVKETIIKEEKESV